MGMQPCSVVYWYTFSPELSDVDQAEVAFAPCLGLSLLCSTAFLIGFSSLNKAHSLDLSSRQKSRKIAGSSLSRSLFFFFTSEGNVPMLPQGLRWAHVTQMHEYPVITLVNCKRILDPGSYQRHRLWWPPLVSQLCSFISHIGFILILALISTKSFPVDLSAPGI